MTAAAPAGRDRPGSCAGHGRRERKKRETRMALADAALELFQRKGYEATTIDEIVAAVPVSQRTFFRYFATKEDLVIGLLAEHDEVMLDALAARPPGERPLTALFEAVRTVLSGIAESEPADSARFRAVRQLIESNPSLVTAQMAMLSAAERDLAELIARGRPAPPHRRDPHRRDAGGVRGLRPARGLGPGRDRGPGRGHHRDGPRGTARLGVTSRLAPE
jgi:AcrR family transcriptional regulator